MAFFKNLAKKFNKPDETPQKVVLPKLNLCSDDEYSLRRQSGTVLTFNSRYQLLAVAVSDGVIIYRQGAGVSFLTVPSFGPSRAIQFVEADTNLLLAVVDAGGATLLIYNLVTQQLVYKYTLKGDLEATHCFSRAGSQYVYFAVDDGTIYVFNIQKMAISSHILNSIHGVEGLVVHPDDESLVFASIEGSIAQLDGVTNTIKCTYKVENSSKTSSYCISTDGKYVVMATVDAQLIFYRLQLDKKKQEAAAPVLVFPMPSTQSGPCKIYCAKFEESTSEYIVYGWSSALSVFQVRVNKAKRVLTCSGISCLTRHKALEECIDLVPIWDSDESSLTHVAILSGEGRVFMVPLNETDPDPLCMDPWQILQDDPLTQCLLIPQVGMEAKTMLLENPIGCGLSAQSEHDFLCPRRLDLLLGRHSSGKLGFWKVNLRQGEVALATMSAFSHLDDVVRMEACYGGTLVLCLHAGSKSKPHPRLSVLDLRAKTEMELWLDPSQFPIEDPSSSSLLNISDAKRPDSPTSPRTPNSPRSPGRAEEEGESFHDKSLIGELQFGEGISSPATPTRNPRTVQDGWWRSPCVGLRLVAPLRLIVVAFANQYLGVFEVETGIMQPVCLKEMIEADVIRRVNSFVQKPGVKEEHVKQARQKILEDAKTCLITSMDVVKCEASALKPDSPSRGATSPSSRIKSTWTILLGTDGGMVYSMSLTDKTIIANIQFPTATLTDSQTEPETPTTKVVAINHVNSWRPQTFGGPVSEKKDIHLNGPPLCPPIPIPVSYTINMTIDTQHLLTSRYTVSGRFEGCFGETLVWLTLTSGGDGSVAMQYGHNRSGGSFASEVVSIFSALDEEVDPLISLSIAHDANAGLYMVGTESETIDTHQLGTSFRDCGLEEVLLSGINFEVAPGNEESFEYVNSDPSNPVSIREIISEVDIVDGYTLESFVHATFDDSSQDTDSIMDPQEGSYMVAIHDKTLAVLSLPTLAALNQIQVPVPLTDLCVSNMGGDGICILTLDGNGRVGIYDVENLISLTTIGLNWRYPLGKDLCFSIVNGAEIQPSQELVVMSMSGDGIHRARLRSEKYTKHTRLKESTYKGPSLAPDLDAAPVSPRSAGNTQQQTKPKKGFMRLFSHSSETPEIFHKLCAQVPESAPRPSPKQSESSPKQSASSSSSKSPASMRSELVGNRGARPPPLSGSAQQGSADDKDIKNVQSGINETRSVMSENRRKLEERGERIAQLGEKTENMANQAANFASMARQLNQGNKNRKWYQQGEVVSQANRDRKWHHL